MRFLAASALHAYFDLRVMELLSPQVSPCESNCTLEGMVESIDDSNLVRVFIGVFQLHLIRIDEKSASRIFAMLFFSAIFDRVDQISDHK